MPMTKTGRPALAAAAATYDGIGPPPAMIVSASPSGIIIAAGACHTTARSAERAIPAGADELDDDHHRRDVAELGHDIFEPLEPRSLAAEDRHIGGAERMDRTAVEAAALQPDDIEAAEAGPLADRRGKGDDVGGNAGEPADEGMRTDPAMLLNRGEPAENRVLAHLAVTAQRGIVDHQNMV